ncbi:MAG: hypothetical protein TEF_21955 [Rhizobiales bacterium NRL2]|jgi:hypothetical protein|nr:MAG: hypothetical protein TEF_21955 [Rhizobiales bacterium NRL2]
MSRHLCHACLAQGYCDALNVRLTTEAEIDDPVWVRNFRTFCFNLRISSSDWTESLHDLYRDMPGRVYVRGVTRREVELFLGMFDRPGIEDWFKAFCNTLPAPGVRCHVRVEARSRVAVMSTILRGHFPQAASAWHLEAANENSPAANDNAQKARRLNRNND